MTVSGPDTAGAGTARAGRSFRAPSPATRYRASRVRHHLYPLRTLPELHAHPVGPGDHARHLGSELDAGYEVRPAGARGGAAPGRPGRRTPVPSG